LRIFWNGCFDVDGRNYGDGVEIFAILGVGNEWNMSFYLSKSFV